MANFNINPAALESLKTSAAYRAGLAVSQRMSPGMVQDVQRLLKLGSFAGGILGTGTGIQALDTVLGIGPNNFEKPTELLGGLKPSDALEIMRQIRLARPARKNLWYIRVLDPNPPEIDYKFSNGTSPTAMFGLFAIEVSYGQWNIQGEKIPIGSAAMDRPITSEAVEMQITTMDDEAGTLKRWFDGKCNQLANGDGTFGLPSEYCVTIEVAHAVPSPDVPVNKMPYKVNYLMRPVSVTRDLSRRDQAIEEFQLTFTQFDTFQQP